MEIHSHGSRASVRAMLSFLQCLETVLRFPAVHEEGEEACRPATGFSSREEVCRAFPSETCRLKQSSERRTGVGREDSGRQEHWPTGGASCRPGNLQEQYARIAMAFSMSAHTRANTWKDSDAFPWAGKEERRQDTSRTGILTRTLEGLWYQMQSERVVHSGACSFPKSPAFRTNSAPGQKALACSRESTSPHPYMSLERQYAGGRLRPAEAGEFALRAFLNGKLQSTEQLEALADIVQVSSLSVGTWCRRGTPGKGLVGVDSCPTDSAAQQWDSRRTKSC